MHPDPNFKELIKSFSFKPSPAKRNYTISILSDNADSWILPWCYMLKDIISRFHRVSLCLKKEEIQQGDMAFLLGCINILPAQFLKRNHLNLVVHESDLPRGRGWSPVAWQVLEGMDHIPVALFEAREQLDSGPVYLRDTIKLDGTELLPEIRVKQGGITVALILKFLELWPEVQPLEQSGQPTFYRRRTIADDKLDVNKTIAENFNHLRITDNESYPAWFEYRGQQYTLKILKQIEE